ncbi:hypothetical protein IMZ48_24245 [Candidatus Bathyarchaeota archaeon]|nr:hypothetical protein [Candidatus Bathyarchaeota archaeon]
MFRTQAASRVVRQTLARTTPVQLRRNATAVPQALSNPTLNNIEKRWESMPLQEQADLWMALRDRMQGSWKELTEQEKRAGGLSLIRPYPFAIFGSRRDRSTSSLNCPEGRTSRPIGH